MKKALIIMTLVAGMAFLTTQADAYRGGWGGGCPGWGGQSSNQNQNTAVDQEAYQKYLTETEDARAELAKIQTQLNTEMSKTEPNAERVRELSAKASELQTDLMLKSREYKVSGGYGNSLCPGPGYGRGMRGGWNY